jgi:exosortase
MKLTARYLPFIALVVVYAPALYDLILNWAQDGNYSHGFLVPLVSLWLAWQKRNEIKQVVQSTAPAGLAVVILGGILFIVGNGGAEYFTVRFSFVLILFGLVWYLFGRDMVRLVWFELAFLLFMIPIPYVIYYALTFPMQLLASKITAGILSGIGMAVFRQGNILNLPDGTSLEVAEACSGMRSLVSLLALGALYAQLTQRRFGAKIILFAATVPIAVVANVFRVFVTALLATTVTPEVAAEPIHSLMGLSVFVVSFILLFILGGILKAVYK